MANKVSPRNQAGEAHLHWTGRVTDMVKFRCEHCRKKIGVPDEFKGKRVRCPQCGQPTRVQIMHALGPTMGTLLAAISAEEARASKTRRPDPSADRTPPSEGLPWELLD